MTTQSSVQCMIRTLKKTVPPSRRDDAPSCYEFREETTTIPIIIYSLRQYFSFKSFLRPQIRRLERCRPSLRVILPSFQNGIDARTTVCLHLEPKMNDTIHINLCDWTPKLSYQLTTTRSDLFRTSSHPW